MQIDIGAIAAEVGADIAAIAEDEERDVLEVLHDMATDCHESIKATAPKDSGRYARSWKLKRREDYLGVGYVVRTQDTGSNPYAAMASWFEHGTADRVTRSGAKRGRMTTKQAHIRRAFEQAVARYQHKLEE